jgi:hypothetical protein
MKIAKIESLFGGSGVSVNEDAVRAHPPRKH